MVQSSILYHNAANTIFLIDIPASIALAQDLSAVQHGPPTSAWNSRPGSPSPQTRNHARPALLSSAPLREPYGASTEPKTEAARARVLARTPASERVLQTETIEPLVRDALAELKRDVPRSVDWCLERVLQRHEAGSQRSAKRKRDAVAVRSDAALPIPDDECHCFVDPSRSVAASWHTPLPPPPPPPPPVILSPEPDGNVFGSMSELCNIVVRNPSAEQALLDIRCTAGAETVQPQQTHQQVYLVPPACSFLLCTLPLQVEGPIPGLPPSRKFNLILLDPPWANRSVRRSGHYQVQSRQGMDLLGGGLGAILKTHIQDGVAAPSLAAIWITNAAKARKAAYDAFSEAGLAVCEEWVWIKTTTRGEPITPVEGVWRKPYEILVIGRKRVSGCEGAGVVRRVVAAVPDVHSRKPNLKEVFERVFFAQLRRASAPSSSAGLVGDTCLSYSALDVFARNLTAGWWACGNEALKFNSREWWEQP
ncbi:MT-A70 family [Aspergillus clavatus NRRL 1]|uniref:MT-A70 family n=1 Tax=Aspergillus clavatus (strain ATCC 1007 / CBS 513.65 / DSM 816 / NCTC 3887 / NRRL 1 / QM 1276 / 107) TaxID=344612 RepID=A1CEB9_ASPCL|nr:MT-A70 family [Aspergillus clavatus NRRL 1]EAW11218.1 MT-A70 family [Aspergillus clavatus NRRL 1]